MNRNIRVKSESPLVGRRYDLAIAAVGYEQRARHAAEVLQPLSDSKVALLFEDRQEHAFTEQRWRS
jgi:hypothetical protein